jgi:hypothetical protein
MHCAANSINKVQGLQRRCADVVLAQGQRLVNHALGVSFVFTAKVFVVRVHRYLRCPFITAVAK